MSLRSVLDCIKYEIKNYSSKYQKKNVPILDIHTLEKIVFYDISTYFPKDFFILDYEPIYAFSRMIERKDIVLVYANNEGKEFFDLLSKLFIKKETGKQKLFFSDFSGVQASKEQGDCAFSEFMTEQFNRNKEQNNIYYIDYNSVRKDVFNTDKSGNKNFIKNAIKLTWSNSIYVSNSDRSHRFALLCKWNEIENKNDSELFNVHEISIDKERLNKLLNSYYGFIIDSKTVSEIIHDLYEKQICIYQFSEVGFKSRDITGLFVKKEDLCNDVVDFLKSSNTIFINDLLK